VLKAASGRACREGQALTLQELWELTEACKGRYRDVVPVLALAGLRWGELAGLQVGDRVSVPGPGLRLRRTVLASGGGALYVDTLKNNRARTVPLVPGPAAGRGSLERREDAGCVVVLRTGRRPAAGVELETFGGLERGHLGGRCLRIPRSRTASYGSVGVAGRWRGPEGSSAGARARDCGDDDGPVWPHDRCQLAAGCPAHRGHIGDI
jgi:hypothetical protein